VSRVDPVTFEVVWHRLLDTTEEMGIKYMRTSGSPVLVGAYDAATGIMLADGRLVAMGPYITTQAHVQRLVVESVLRMRAKAIGPNDMFVCNDPYLGATHQPDVATVAPVHLDGELQAWVGASGHWLDIGGPEPGGFNMNADSVYDEGLRMPPTKLVDAGVIREDVLELILNQVREPLVELDLRGQVVANQTGKERLAALFDEYGPQTVRQVMEEGIGHVERRLRARLREIPDGVWREIQYLDHDGKRPEIRQIVCTVTKRGERLTIDFSGSDPQNAAFVNCTYSGLRAATLSALCIMLCWDTAWNDGVANCVDIVVPPRTVVSAEHPAPVSSATITAIIVTLNLVFGAVAKMLLASPKHRDEAMANWCSTSIGVSILGTNDRGVTTLLPESSHFAAGCGARTNEDGVDTGGIIINTTANIPSIEASEAEYPVLYLFRRQVRDSGGPGRFRGGVAGSVALVSHDGRDVAESSFAGVGAEVPNAYGLAGGLPGACVSYLRFHDAGSLEELTSGGRLPADLEEIPGRREVTPINNAHAPFPVGMVEYHNWQGGGGYGDPLERDPSQVERDVLNRLVSEEMARSQYGILLADGSVDREATEQLRASMFAERKERGRPATEVLEASEWGEVVAWVDEESSHGSLRYGDAVVFDFEAHAARCTRCDESLGEARGDFRMGCLVEEVDPWDAGPVRGEACATGRVVLRRFSCPGCGRQLETEVGLRDGDRPGFRLAGGVKK
jgi:N-methylhydantoinase B